MAKDRYKVENIYAPNVSALMQIIAAAREVAKTVRKTETPKQRFKTRKTKGGKKR